LKNNDPEFFPTFGGQESLKMQMQKNYQDTITHLQIQWNEADLDNRCYLGDPDVWNILYPIGSSRRRKMFSFNIPHSLTQVVTGHQRRNRKSIIAIPVMSPIQKTADQFTKCLYHITGNGAHQVFSDAFEHGALVKGFGLIAVFPDYSKDPVSPEIKFRYIDMNSVLLDCFFRQKDLSDCRFIWTRQYFAREEACDMYPDYRDFIMSVPLGTPPKDDKFYYMPENIGLNTTYLIAFDEYWYLSTRDAYFAVDLQTEETKEIEGDAKDIKFIEETMSDKIKIVKKRVKTIRRAILLNNQIMLDEERPYGLDRYPFVGVYGNFNPDTIYFNYKFKGFIRDIRDPAYLFNLRKIADLDILSAQQQGLKVKKGALLNPDDSLNTGHGRVLVINDKNQMSDVEPMQIIPPSPVMLQMEEMLKTVMREITGVNEELLGAAVDDKAGVLAMLRQGAGLTTLQKYFDQFDESMREVGEIIICMIQKLWSYGKVKSVIGEEPTAEFDNKAFFRYGVKVVQGVLTETQQQLELAQIFELQQRFPDLIPPEEVVERMTIQNKDSIIEKIEANKKQMQEQQQQMQQMQMQQMQVENETKLAYARSQDGLSQERIARIKTDVAIAEDKLKRAHTEDTSALLNMVRAIKELQGMDLTHLQQQIEILQMMQPEVAETPTVAKKENVA